MHYYKRNLGDYAKKAGRLSMLQHGAYTLLIDSCYDREQFPTLEDAIEWTWASTTEEIEAVKFVLSKFFTLKDAVYVQKRIQEEIAEYDLFCARQKEKGSKGGRPKVIQQLPEDNPTGLINNPIDSQQKPNETLTTNHKPLTTNQQKPKPLVADATGFNEFWEAYPRKEAKPKALAAWKKLTPPLQQVIDALTWQKAQEQWIKDGGQFIPLPASYLNAKRWLDEPQVIVAKPIRGLVF